MSEGESADARVIGRYVLFARIAAGGMATVHLGRLVGQAGFSRTVAIKRLHPHLASDPEFVAMLVDEARLAARVRHPNVVSTIDVVALDGELLVCMEYVHGDSLARLQRKLRNKKERVPPAIASAIFSAVLSGLHAAHEATDERGLPLGIIHRDVSPQNIMVGVDGVARVVDFGVAKAAGRLQQTREGVLKGKLRYMSLEQLRGAVDRSTDVYSAALVLWECLTGRRFFDEADDEWSIAQAIQSGKVSPPSTFASEISPALDAVVMTGLDRERTRRFKTALEMAEALEDAVAPATARQVGLWVEQIAGDVLTSRTAQLEQVEAMAAAMDIDGKPDPAAPESLRRDVKAIVGAAATSGDTATTHLMQADGPERASGPPVAATPEEPPGYQRLVLLAGAAAVTVFVVGLAIVLAFRVKQPASASAPGAASRAEEVVLAASAAPTASLSNATPEERHPAASTAPRPRRVPQFGGAHPSCNPPFYFDEAGVKHLKRECL